MIGLDDCGRELLLTFGHYTVHQTEVKAIMVIKAPRGTMVIFESKAWYMKQKCRGIRAFMKEHIEESRGFSTPVNWSLAFRKEHKDD